MIDTLPAMSGCSIDAGFDNKLTVGNAFVRNFDGDNTSHMRIGIAGLSGQSGLPFVPVNDLMFTQTVVTLYHEYGHYLQNYESDKDIQCMISEVSVIGNPSYYVHAWKTLPHEISAEYTGVSMAWAALSEAFPGKADACVLEYINHRACNTAYMLPAKPGGMYRSRDEVDAVFETVMDNALCLPREPFGGFLRYQDESVRLVTQDCENYRCSVNAYHADKLIDSVPGEKKDRMMAALVLALHPDILKERPELVSESITVEHEFGRSLAVASLPGPMKAAHREELSRSGVQSDMRSCYMAELERLASCIETADTDDYEFGG